MGYTTRYFKLHSKAANPQYWIPSHCQRYSGQDTRPQEQTVMSYGCKLRRDHTTALCWTITCTESSNKSLKTILPTQQSTQESSEKSYLSKSKARSRAGGHRYLSNQPSPQPPPPNGPILNIAKILRHVMSSTAKAKLGALFLNAKEGTVLRTTLEEMGHPQPATPLQTDNSTANGISNGTCKQRQSRAIDMRFYWVRDQTQQGHFNVFWAPGTDNLADYFTKHHSPAHHR